MQRPLADEIDALKREKLEWEQMQRPLADEIDSLRREKLDWEQKQHGWEQKQKEWDSKQIELTRLVSDFEALRRERLEWERREADLGKSLVRSAVEYQALQSRSSLDQYRSRVQLGDADRRLGLASAEIAALHVTIRELLAERKHGTETADPNLNHLAEITACQAEIDRLTVELREAQAERERLSYEIATSLALRMARSLGWILEPIRKAIGGREPGERQ
jgi:hypothetical protein